MTEFYGKPGANTFKSKFRGDVITADSTEYEALRRIWNNDADRYPLAIVQPLDVDDVITAVRFGREANLLTAVRCGGHSYQGYSTCDGGLVIDLSKYMNKVSYDEKTQCVRAQGGALLGKVDQTLVPIGRVVPAGIVSHTGLSGLALGGGIGYLTRSFGMTCDQFVRLEVITADGERVYASESEHPDLFWALRGGGGNFGIVTEFELRTHELGPVQSGGLIYPMENAVEIIEELVRLVEAAPRTLSIWFGLAVKPAVFELEGYPDDARLLLALVVYRGEPDDDVLKAVRSCGNPMIDAITGDSFLALQKRLDIASQHGVGWYMKSGHVVKMSTSLIERLVSGAMEYQDISSPLVEREVYGISAIGGAANDVGEGETAYSGRGANWHLAIEVGFTNPEERERVVSWTKQDWAKTEKLLDMKTSYVNMNFEEDGDALKKVYGSDKLKRLRGVKAKYDPDNFFRMNSNIVPAEE